MDMKLEDVKSIVEEAIGKKYDEVMASVDAKLKAVEPQHERQYFKGEQQPQSVAGGSKGLNIAKTAKLLAELGPSASQQSMIAAAEKSGDANFVKALNATQFENGAALIPENQSNEIIDMLTPMTIIRSMGPTVIPLIGGNMSFNKATDGPIAYYTGEGQDLRMSGAKFGQIKMTEKELNVLVPISNKLLRNSGPAVDTFIRNKMLQFAKLKEDLTFMQGEGTEYAPKGLKYWTTAANKITANATVNIENITLDCLKAVGKLLAANVELNQTGWIMNPLTYTYLMSMRDATGNLIFAPQLERGMFFGLPFKYTTTVPIVGSGAAANTELYLVNFGHVIIGDVPGMELAITNEASYVNESGQLVSAFSKGETLFKLTMRHDMIVEHEEALVMITGAKWLAV